MPKYTEEAFHQGLPLKILTIIQKLLQKSPRDLVGEKIKDLLAEHQSNLDEMADLRVRDVYALLIADWICKALDLTVPAATAWASQDLEKSPFYQLYEALLEAFEGVDLTSFPATGKVIDQFLQSDKVVQITSVTEHALSNQIYQWLEQLRNILLHLQNIEKQRFDNPEMRTDLLHAYELFERVAQLVTSTTSVSDLQNMFVEEGKKVYRMGAFSSSSKMLSLKRHELIAWHMAQSILLSTGAKMERLTPKQQDILSSIYTALCHIESARNQPDINAPEYNTQIDTLCLEIKANLERAIFVQSATMQQALLLLRKNLSVYDRFAPLLGKSQNEKKMQGLVVGDSWSISLNATESRPWLEMLLESLRADGYPVDIANISFAGSQTVHGVHLLPEQLRIWRPQFVLITLGGNDAFQSVPIWETAYNILQMIKICREFDPKIHIMVSFGIPETFTAASGCHRRAVEDFIQAIHGQTLEPGNYAQFFLKSFEALLVQEPRVKAELLEQSLLKNENIGPDQVHAKDVTGLFKQSDRALRPILDQIMLDKGLSKHTNAPDEPSEGQGESAGPSNDQTDSGGNRKEVAGEPQASDSKHDLKNDSATKVVPDPVHQALFNLVVRQGWHQPPQPSTTNATDSTDDTMVHSLQQLVHQQDAPDSVLPLTGEGAERAKMG